MTNNCRTKQYLVYIIHYALYNIHYNKDEARFLNSLLPTQQVADGVEGRSGGDVLSAIFAVLMGSMMFGQTAPGIAALGTARGAAVDVFETLERVPPIDSSSDEGLKPEKVEGHVQFDSVGFSYVRKKITSLLMIPYYSTIVLSIIHIIGIKMLHTNIAGRPGSSVGNLVTF